MRPACDIYDRDAHTGSQWTSRREGAAGPRYNLTPGGYFSFLPIRLGTLESSRGPRMDIQ